MARIEAFRAYRPRPDVAAQVASPPYDVLNSAEAREMAEGNPLSFLHVNKASRGRTCRACHEVHAAEQAHIVRDGVPYGSKGWVLPIIGVRPKWSRVRHP